MKRNVITALSLSAILLCGTTTAFAQEVQTPVAENPSAEASIPALPERYLAYGRITDIQKENGVITSITAKDVKDQTVIYIVSEDTLCLDSGKGTQMNINDLKVGDGVYFYHSPAMNMSLPPQTVAEAIVGNMPMDAACARFHTVEAVENTQNGIRITTDGGGLYITVSKDATVTSYADNSAFDLANLKEGDRIFTWYDVVAESYPAQAGVNRLVVVPAAEDTKTVASPVKVSYSKSEMTTKNDVTCVPLRETADALGLTLTWDRDSRTATLESDTRSMDLVEGKDLYVSTSTIPGAVGMTSPSTLGVAPYVADDGAMYVPAEAFEWLVGYDVAEDDTTVTITAEK
ncbi:stalk domain-containing protein [Anaerotignum sp.]|uniref:stalk domain-containing protein n=1 Tax=Anaerotignum sp. TaxID=2039241 RepID=UPI003735507B